MRTEDRPRDDSVLWHKPSEQFYAVIGNWRVVDGKPVRAYHYLGRNETAARALAARKRRTWRRIKIETRERDRDFRATFPGAPPAIPVWPAGDGKVEKQTVVGSPTGNYDPAKVTIRDAMADHFADDMDRVGQAGDKGLKIGSCNTNRDRLHIALGISTAKDAKDVKVERAVPITLDTTLAEIAHPVHGHALLKAFVTFWMALPPGVDSSRTAKNYVNALGRLLHWCEQEKPKYGFRLPPGAEKLLHIEVSTKRIARYHPQLLRELLSCATERGKLVQILALNAGVYQKDLSDLEDEEEYALIQHNGRPCLWWIRSKETSNERNTFRICTPLWPEAYRLILKFRAKANPRKLLFLNNGGKPLVVEILGKRRVDSVSRWFNSARKKLAKRRAKQAGRTDWKSFLPKFTFKQFRKVVRGLIRKQSTEKHVGQYLAKFWCGQVMSGVDFDYDELEPSDYDCLFPVVDKVREKLIADGVFEAVR